MDLRRQFEPSARTRNPYLESAISRCDESNSRIDWHYDDNCHTTGLRATVEQKKICELLTWQKFAD